LDNPETNLRFHDEDDESEAENDLESYARIDSGISGLSGAVTSLDLDKIVSPQRDQIASAG